jgi:hypothetical protein
MWYIERSIEFRLNYNHALPILNISRKAYLLEETNA